MKGFCKDNKRLIAWNEPSGAIDINQLIGARVKVRQISGRDRWSNTRSTYSYISDIRFRISTDGKCFTVVYLKDRPGISFTLADLEIVEINEDGQSS